MKVTFFLTSSISGIDVRISKIELKAKVSKASPNLSNTLRISKIELKESAYDGFQNFLEVLGISKIELKALVVNTLDVNIP